MGITRDSVHKRRSTSGRKKALSKKRKHDLGRPAANTKIGTKRVHIVRCRGGNKKYRALRLDSGHFSWKSECVSKKTRILDVVYNASNNEFVRTKTLVKNAIIKIDATPFRQWYEEYYQVPLGRKKGHKNVDKKQSNKAQRKYAAREKMSEVEQPLENQFTNGKVLACISSRPGQSGRCDGYILEGNELDFYLKKLKKKN